MITTGFRPQNTRRYHSNQNCAPKTARGPLFNVGESDHAYHIHLAVPGWNKEQISIETKDGHLYIKGTKEEPKNADIKFHRKMFGQNNFQRSFIIPEDVNIDDISAKFENGILQIALSKDIKKSTPKSINIL